MGEIMGDLTHTRPGLACMGMDNYGPRSIGTGDVSAAWAEIMRTEPNCAEDGRWGGGGIYL